VRSLVLDAGVLSLHFGDDPRITGYFDEIDDSRCSGYIGCQRRGVLLPDL
jgi:hypothetical protein